MWKSQPIRSISLGTTELKASGAEGDRCLASMGIYVFNASAMEDALEGDATDFGKEIIPTRG